MLRLLSYIPNVYLFPGPKSVTNFQDCYARETSSVDD